MHPLPQIAFACEGSNRCCLTARPTRSLWSGVVTFRYHHLVGPVAANVRRTRRRLSESPVQVRASFSVRVSALGLVAFAIAELSLSHSTLDSTNHDMMLGQRLGLIYTPAVGAWLGWLQSSRRPNPGRHWCGSDHRCHLTMCCVPGRTFWRSWVGFPMLLGGGVAALVGSNRALALEDSSAGSVRV